jgi:hypothetical protein
LHGANGEVPVGDHRYVSCQFVGSKTVEDIIYPVYDFYCCAGTEGVTPDMTQDWCCDNPDDCPIITTDCGDPCAGYVDCPPPTTSSGDVSGCQDNTQLVSGISKHLRVYVSRCSDPLGCADCPPPLPFSFLFEYNAGTNEWEGTGSATSGGCTVNIAMTGVPGATGHGCPGAMAISAVVTLTGCTCTGTTSFGPNSYCSPALCPLSLGFSQSMAFGGGCNCQAFLFSIVNQ